MCELREGSRGAGVFDRGAEDCEEGDEGGGEKEEIECEKEGEGWRMDVWVSGVVCCG